MDKTYVEIQRGFDVRPAFYLGDSVMSVGVWLRQIGVDTRSAAALIALIGNTAT